MPAWGKRATMQGRRGSQLLARPMTDVNGAQ